MGQPALIDNRWMRATECCVCGIAFAMTHELYEQRQKDRGFFHCPNGHSQHFVGKTPEQKRIEALEAEVARYRQSRQWAEQQAKGANIAAGMAKGKLRRVIARVHAGVCPHCNRTFKQLAQHMKAKHPKGKA